MESDDLPLTIPLKSIEEFFSCPVCMGLMQEVHTTPCGHRYCGRCIKECATKLRKCPCCNALIQPESLIKDNQFDALAAIVKEEKDRSEKEYFDRLINEAGKCDGDDSNATKPVSVIEEVLRKHLKKNVIEHEKYIQKLASEFRVKEEQAALVHKTQVERLQRQSLMEEEFERRQTEMQEALQEQKERIEQDYHTCLRLVANAYDRYLTEHIPSLNILPVTIDVVVLSKNAEIPNVCMNPHDSLDTVKSSITKYFEDLGDSVEGFSDDINYFYFSPHAKRSRFEMMQLCRDIIENGATNSDVVLLTENCRPVLEFSMRSGGLIAVYGTVMCESDKPPECFARQFEAGKSMTMDYFSCQGCKCNWICKSCMEVCHKDHHVVPYLQNHQPSWACCYCPKKKKCVLIT